MGNHGSSGRSPGSSGRGTTVGHALLAVLALAALGLGVLPVRAHAADGARFLISPTGFDFGEVEVGTTSPPQRVQVVNLGPGPATLNMAGGAAGVFGGTQNCQGATLAVGEACQITYRFKPTEIGEVTRETSGTINEQPFSFDFRGTGIAAGADPSVRFLISPTGFDFGEVAVDTTSPPQMAQVINQGPGPVTVMTMTGGAAGVFDRTQNCQGGTLAVGESCQITYRFTPSEAGDVTRTTSGTINGQSFSFSFHGTGIGGDGEGGDGEPAPGPGYWVLEEDGDLVAFGDAPELPSTKPDLPGARAVAMAAHPDGEGLWVLTSAGDIVARGTATDFGQVDLGLLSEPGEQVATVSATPDGEGLWVFTTAGRIIAFGTALPGSSMAGSDAILALDLDGPIIDSVATPSGQGAYLVASDGGVFAVGDAEFIDSVRGRLTTLFGPPGLPDQPVVGIVPDPDGFGYWNVAADGGVFAFEAPFRGSLPAIVPFDDLVALIRGMVPYGNGYLLVAGDGGVFAFSNLPFEGSASGQVDSPVVDIATRG